MNRPSRARSCLALAGVLVFALTATPALAAAVEAPFAASYSVVDLGSIAGVPTAYGGVTFKLGDPNTLVIGGAANSSSGALYAVGVTRGGDGRITGFAGPAASFADGANNDGGLAYGPGGVLFATRYNLNEIGQSRAGSTTTDRVISLGPLGIPNSPGGLNFVPAGFPGAGRFKVTSYSPGAWFDVTLAPDGLGTFNFVSVTRILGFASSVEGFAYVPLGSPLFAAPSVLVAEYGNGNVVAYDVDANGDPVLATRRVVLSGLNGPEGIAVDPLTGDVVVSSYLLNRVFAIRGFAVPAGGESPPIPPPPPGRFDISLTCRTTASRGELISVAATFRNHTDAARRITRAGVTLHAGAFNVVGPTTREVSVVVDARTIGDSACPGCPPTVTPGTGSVVGIPVLMPPQARPLSFASIALSFFGEVGADSRRRLLGTEACVVEITR